MDPLPFNIKHIRQEKGMTQQDFANYLGIKRSLLGAYEEGRARPKLSIQQEMARLAGITLDQLLTTDISDNGVAVNQEKPVQQQPPDGRGDLRVLSVTVDQWGRNNIEVVPAKAETGYIEGHHDPEYLRELSKCHLPFLPEGNYRAFEIKDEAMPPLQSGSYVVGEYVMDWRNIQDEQAYIVVSKSHGILYRRIVNKIYASNVLELQADAPSFSILHLGVEEELLEVWQDVLYITFGEENGAMSQQKLTNIVLELQQEVMRLKRKIGE